MRAASVLLRESRLSRSIRKEGAPLQQRKVFLVELSWEDSAKRAYVLDPSVPITIGREPDLNQISIRQDQVSAEHCKIALHKGKLIVQDLNSVNGTYIKRFFFKQRVNGAAYIKRGDKLIVGGIVMTVTPFEFDAAYV